MKRGQGRWVPLLLIGIGWLAPVSSLPAGNITLNLHYKDGTLISSPAKMKVVAYAEEGYSGNMPVLLTEVELSSGNFFSADPNNKLPSANKTLILLISYGEYEIRVDGLLGASPRMQILSVTLP